MSKKIKFENLSTEINKIVEEYSEDIIKEANNVVEEYGEKMKNEVETSTPVGDGRKGHLRDKWAVELTSSGLTKKATVYVKGRKRNLTHLLEFGTYKMAARPFMTPSFNRISPDFVKAMKTRLSKK